MARLPTVKLEQYVNGKRHTLIVNQTDYARDIAKFKDWKAISWRRGDASDDVVEFAAQQTIVEMQRQEVPGHPASKDMERAKDSRTLYVYEADKEPDSNEGESAEESQPETVSENPEPDKEADWKSMKWFAMKKHVKEKTGHTPKNKQDAERLMEGMASDAMRDEAVTTPDA